QIARVAKKKILVGTKSTVPVGTGDKIEGIFKEEAQQGFVVFSNPEFLKEGNAVNDFMKPDRIVVGLNDSSVLPLIHDLYAPFTRQKDRLIVMSRRSAELTKYAANAMLATRISFMNEMANLCESVGASIDEVRRGIGSDPRIGPAFLYAGMGFGGSCFPKDLKALVKTAVDADSPLSVVQAAESANQRQKEILFKKIVRHYGGREKLKGLKFAVWGLSFKAKTDDIRESAALALIDRLLEAQCVVAAFDPQALDSGRQKYGDRVSFCKTSYDCLDKASGLVIATDWNEFRSPDFARIKSLLHAPVIFDGRNLYNKKHLQDSGFTYYGIGV
ncbi:MAG: UDP-glucose/GDP-mannose dehydrogenase family protein, partial [Deltaproteobacteria bacterium]|nr:UDP-glucose/GDP-mannose dehydrogenase family protein [Deltaproteobacteria bacterium]